MRLKTLLSTLAIVFCQLLTAQAIFTNSITGTNPGTVNPYTIGQTAHPNITVNGIGRGSGIGYNPANDRYNANGWNTANLDANDYFEFVLTPHVGYSINFVNLVYESQASGTGPGNFAIRSSVDNFTANIGTPTNGISTINLTTAPFQNITSQIRFRLYAWGASASGGTFSVNEFTFNGTVTNCVSANTITPSSGPVGTELLITATSNNLNAASVTIGGITAVVTQVSATQVKAIVPAGATTGAVVTTNSTGCITTNAFTVISNVITSCEGSGGSRPFLFISEITDHGSGSHTYVEIFNATGAAVNLLNYSIRIHNNGNTNATSTITLPLVNLANNSTYVVAFGGQDANTEHGGIKADFFSTAGGINNDDHIRLHNPAGTGIDLWGDPSGASFTFTNNYYFRRKNTGITAPSTTWNPNDWTSGSPVDYTDVGSYSFAAGSPPVVTLHPASTPSCSALSLSVAGTEGFVGGDPLAYQWYVAAPGAASWTAITNNTIYSGANLSTLTISDITGLGGYQYYSQIRENTATCYSASNATMIREYSSLWNGSAWIPSAPIPASLVTIAGNYNTANNGSFDACSLIVNNGAALTIGANNYVSVQNHLTVNNGGNLTVSNDGSLVMINEAGVVTNNGTMRIERTTTPYNRYDYTYWSSPVVAANIGTTFTGWRTDYSFTFTTANFSDVTGPLGTGPADGLDDDNNAWTAASDAVMMTPGKGYAIMAPTTGATFPTTSTVGFTGRVNNGIISIPMALSANTANANDDFNLVGNPYPSAISANSLINANTNISGTLYFWTHHTPISPPGPGGSSFITDDYAMYNLAGGTVSASGGSMPTGMIASGQGFFVEAQSASNLVFNNTFRSKTYSNDDFFRPVATSPTSREKIWLNLTHEQGLFSQQLIGYFPEATLGFDRGYDGIINPARNTISFYSMIGADQYRIQGRPQFTADDVVRLGYKSGIASTFKISIGAVEGQFASDAMSIYLVDNTTGMFHNLKQSDYLFTTDAGHFNDRFELRYIAPQLGNPDYALAQNEVKIVAVDQQVAIKSAQPIAAIQIYDIAGRLLFTNRSVNATDFATGKLGNGQMVLIVRVLLANGLQIDRKVML